MEAKNTRLNGFVHKPSTFSDPSDLEDHQVHLLSIVLYILAPTLTIISLGGIEECRRRRQRCWQRQIHGKAKSTYIGFVCYFKRSDRLLPSIIVERPKRP